MVLSFTFYLSLPNNIFHFLILFPVIILVCSSKKQTNVMIIDTIYATETRRTSQQRGDELARRTNYRARQHSLSGLPQSFLLYLQVTFPIAIAIASRGTDTYIHGRATDHAGFHQRIFCVGYFQAQRKQANSQRFSQWTYHSFQGAPSVRS